MNEWPIRAVPIEDILPHPDNPYSHPEAQMKGLAASHGEFGNIGVSVWNERTGHLIDGHARHTLAKTRGEKTIDCRVVDWDEETEHRALLTINRTGHLAQTSPEKMLELLAQFDVAGDDLLSNLWSEDAIKALEELQAGGESKDEQTNEDPDREEEPTGEVETRAKSGDTWTLGRHKIFVGRWEDAPFLFGADVVFTDPPYEIGKVPKDFVNGDGSRSVRPSLEGIRDNDLDTFNSADFLDGLRAQFFSKVAGEPTGSAVYLFCNKTLIEEYLQWGRTEGYRSTLLVWEKDEQPIPIGGQHWADCEYLVYLSKGGLWNDSDAAPEASRKRVLHHSRRGGTAHPTEKPLYLVINQLRLTTKKGFTVIDPFLGSGTTLIACERLNLTCYGAELSPQFADIILARWENDTGGVATVERESHSS